jgi:phage N-6-adenine-methyltransferase
LSTNLFDIELTLDVWITPPVFYRRLDAEFNFTLDPCASPENAKCERFYTVRDNGLAQDSSRETVFMHPPHDSSISSWMQKAWESTENGATVVALVPASTDAEWWHLYAMKASEIRFVRGRLRYWDPGLIKAPSASALVIYKPNHRGRTMYGSMMRIRVERWSRISIRKARWTRCEWSAWSYSPSWGRGTTMTDRTGEDIRVLFNAAERGTDAVETLERLAWIEYRRPG